MRLLENRGQGFRTAGIVTALCCWQSAETEDTLEDVAGLEEQRLRSKKGIRVSYGQTAALMLYSIWENHWKLVCSLKVLWEFISNLPIF